MPSIYSQVGGYRVGRNFWLSFHASWPFATLEIYPERIVLAGLWRRYEFSRAVIIRLSDYEGLFSSGLRIEHSVVAYPRLVVFWPRDFAALQDNLRANGFPVSTPEA